MKKCFTIFSESSSGLLIIIRGSHNVNVDTIGFSEQGFVGSVEISESLDYFEPVGKHLVKAFAGVEADVTEPFGTLFSQSGTLSTSEDHQGDSSLGDLFQSGTEIFGVFLEVGPVLVFVKVRGSLVGFQPVPEVLPVFAESLEEGRGLLGHS